MARGSPWLPVPPPQTHQRQCPLRTVCHVPFLLGSSVSLLVIAIIYTGYGNNFLHLLTSWGSFMIPAIPFFLHVMAVRAGQETAATLSCASTGSAPTSQLRKGKRREGATRRSFRPRTEGRAGRMKAEGK